MTREKAYEILRALERVNDLEMQIDEISNIPAYSADKLSLRKGANMPHCMVLEAWSTSDIEDLVSVIQTKLDRAIAELEAF